jgi:hypothetical protein
MMKELPDFDCMPVPIRWFSKFGIKPREIETTKEYLASQYTFVKQYELKDLPPLIIDEPQKDSQGNIKLVAVAPPEEIKVETISRPFEYEQGKTLVVLPSLRDDSDIVKSLETIKTA